MKQVLRNIAWGGMLVGISAIFYMVSRGQWAKPEIFIGVVGVFVAFFALVLTETTVHDAKVTLQTANERLENTLAEIKKQEERLEKDIIDLEDATRRSLVGFAEIFERSLWLLSQAEREIVYANFVLGFGGAHTQNENIHAAYQALPNKRSNVNFKTAADTFMQTLIEKSISGGISKLKFVTLEDDSVDSSFLEALANREGYQYLKDGEERARILSQEKTYRAKLSHILRARRSDESNVEEWRVGQRLPIQVLIAGLPPKVGKPNETRFGCIVFLLGSENIGGIKQAGRGEVGFYTELQHIIEMYRDFVDNVAANFKVLHPEPIGRDLQE